MPSTFIALCVNQTLSFELLDDAGVGQDCDIRWIAGRYAGSHDRSQVTSSLEVHSASRCLLPGIHNGTKALQLVTTPYSHHIHCADLLCWKGRSDGFLYQRADLGRGRSGGWSCGSHCLFD